jgi:hypothetical protein
MKNNTAVVRKQSWVVLGGVIALTVLAVLLLVYHNNSGGTTLAQEASALALNPPDTSKVTSKVTSNVSLPASVNALLDEPEVKCSLKQSEFLADDTDEQKTNLCNDDLCRYGKSNFCTQDKCNMVKTEAECTDADCAWDGFECRSLCKSKTVKACREDEKCELDGNPIHREDEKWRCRAKGFADCDLKDQTKCVGGCHWTLQTFAACYPRANFPPGPT